MIRSRRQFLGEASCAAIGSVSVLSTLLNLKLANQAAASDLTPGEDCKTIVCILLAGGCDTFNLLVRRDAAGHAEYAGSRTNLALASEDLIPLNQAGAGDGNLYGVHPGCQGLADMFNGSGAFAGSGRRLSFVANIGTLVQPTTLADYLGGTVSLPKSLFSHIDQITQWQTSVPQGLGELTGWAGRMADVLHSTYNTGATSMSISLAGNNVFQIGNEVAQFSITDSGALLPTGDTAGLGSTTARKNLAVDGLLTESYNNLMQDAFAKHVKHSHEAQAAFNAVYQSIDDSAIAPLFPNSKIAKQLLAAAKTIKARDALGLRRSTIFIQRGNWDHHGELLVTQAAMLDELAAAISAYQQALEILGVADDVISYTASDFGRTLRSNGRGTDHAWGGNQMVWGGPVDGGKVFGTFPSLALDGPDDVGLGGRLLPSTSIDKFFEEIAAWFGVSSTDMPLILPNIGSFSGEPPVGFIA
ncbi:DUF1501domain-containing protein [Haloferula helveola]|uniref:DUF1501domain-containing protein n=1 Tax=Haloferula helveola TaxID=490095 RepID=A0ABM7R6Q4_9BACT|nr:DUF1501domain-containing protein [Haloferula helveola]